MEKLHSKTSVFITGINGFTGIHLEKYLLKKGYAVFGIVNKKSKDKNHFVCDLLDKSTLFNILNKVKPDFIYHLAAVSFVNDSNKLNMYNVNVFGTLNLLSSITELNLKPRKILIASSAAVYGNQNKEVLDESMNPLPVNHYGNSKLVMENMVRTYFNKLDIFFVRPFNYTGIGQNTNFLIPKIVWHFKEKKKNIELGNIEVFREFNDVRDVVKTYHRLMKSNLKSDVINVCSGQEISLKEIISKMELISNHKIQIKVNPKFVRQNEIKILKGSVTKLRKVMPLKKTIFKYDISDTLKEMYNFLEFTSE
ncbi:MAG: GDP-mannose 4,6-dehydratase [Flavobacteriaceae bacterium]|nr:GDP-mannose 4,6-dehydratase [Flavobacteriaceae bacterium]